MTSLQRSVIGYLIGFLFIFSALSFVDAQQCRNLSERRTPLSLGIFLSDPYKSQLRPTIDIALRHIQEQSHYFDNYCLRLIFKDTKQETSAGMQALFELMNGTSRPFGIFGDAYTNVNEPLAMASKYFHLLHLSYAETHAKFATADAQEMYPTFFRIVPGDQNLNKARSRLIAHFEWRKIGTLKQSDNSKYALPHEWLTIMLEHQHRVNVNYTAGITQTELNNIGRELDELKKRDLRIFVGDFSESLASRIMCEVFHKQMYGENYVWILPGHQNSVWWTNTNGTNCSTRQLKRAINGHFAIKFAPYSPQLNETIISRKTVRAVKKELESSVRTHRGIRSEFIGYAYDGVWTLTMAMHRALNTYQTLHSAPYRPSNNEETRDIMHKYLMQALNETSFDGVTGRVRFDDNDRLGVVQILQWRNGSYVDIGYYDSAKDDFRLYPNIRGWRAPLDSSQEIEQRVYVESVLFIVASLVAVTGIAVAFIFLIINVHFRNHRFIKMSSPNMNNLIIAGSICIYASIILLGIDTRLVSAKCFVSLCYVKTWVLCLGFTLAFGSMFSKTWRVHSIFTNICMNKKAIKDYKLFIIVGFFVLIDVFTLFLWAFISPYSISVINLDSYVLEDKLVRIKPLVERCHSNESFVFQAILLVTKGLLMILGCFFAWETRHVNVPALNDSKYIGISVYIVVLVSSLGISLAFILQDRINKAYGLTSFFIFIGTTATLCFVFMPKVWVVLKRSSKEFNQKGRRDFMKSVIGNQPKHNSAHTSKIIQDEKEHLARMEKDNQTWRKVLQEKTEQLRSLTNDENSTDSSFKICFPARPGPPPTSMIEKISKGPILRLKRHFKRKKPEDALYTDTPPHKLRQKNSFNFLHITALIAICLVRYLIYFFLLLTSHAIKFPLPNLTPPPPPRKFPCQVPNSQTTAKQ